MRRNNVQVVQAEMYSARLKDFEVWGRQGHPRQDLPPDHSALCPY